MRPFLWLIGLILLSACGASPQRSPDTFPEAENTFTTLESDIKASYENLNKVWKAVAELGDPDSATMAIRLMKMEDERMGILEERVLPSQDIRLNDSNTVILMETALREWVCCRISQPENPIGFFIAADPEDRIPVIFNRLKTGKGKPIAPTSKSAEEDLIKSMKRLATWEFVVVIRIFIDAPPVLNEEKGFTAGLTVGDVLVYSLEDQYLEASIPFYAENSESVMALASPETKGKHQDRLVNDLYDHTDEALERELSAWFPGISLKKSRR